MLHAARQSPWAHAKDTRSVIGLQSPRKLDFLGVDATTSCHYLTFHCANLDVPSKLCQVSPEFKSAHQPRAAVHHQAPAPTLGPAAEKRELSDSRSALALSYDQLLNEGGITERLVT